MLRAYRPVQPRWILLIAFTLLWGISVCCRFNGRLVPLDYQLKNGDIVHILSSKQDAGPSRDWLQFVKTSKAKNRIRQWLREQHREENIQIGRDLLERELKKHTADIHENLKADLLLEAAKKLGFGNIQDLLAAVGDLKVSPNLVITKLGIEKEPDQELKPELEEKRRARRSSQGVQVKGVDNLLVRFSKCCNPVPGDLIIGFVTRGKGVSVHRTDCPNLIGEDSGTDH